jgi:hypothetical protein
LNSKIVIDAGRNGNEARFINHGCEPNCESGILARRVFIDAIRTIRAGEELVYDYQITRDPDDPDDVDEVFACRCGAPGCRGSMLEPKKPPRKKPKSKPKRGAKSTPRAKSRPRKHPRPRTATRKTQTIRRRREGAEPARRARPSRRARD